jgi:hypothetical protein
MIPKIEGDDATAGKGRTKTAAGGGRGRAGGRGRTRKQAGNGRGERARGKGRAKKAAGKGRRRNGSAKRGKRKAGEPARKARKHADELIDHRLTKALSHPMRVSILAIANQRVISPKEYSEEFDFPLTTVAYHFRRLKKFDCIELVAEVPVRGAQEHRYRGSRRGLITDANWSAFGRGIQASLRVAGLQDYLNRCRQALDAETFDSREDAIFYWVAGVVDEIGWGKFTQAMGRLIEEVANIEVESAERMAADGTDPVPMTFAVSGFESPKDDQGRKRAKGKSKRGS